MAHFVAFWGSDDVIFITNGTGVSPGTMTSSKN
jgi:hypothetical protein